MPEQHSQQISDDGAVALPAEIRERHGWVDGTVLIAIDDDYGVFLAGAEETHSALFSRAGRHGLVRELLRDSAQNSRDGESA